MAAVGRIFNIGHYAVHDGPGIRTTVFLKGCPARCLWCCSPQSQSFEIERSADGGKIFGRELTAAELFAEVRRDAPFWRRSGGGVTLSGGEAMAQPDFVMEFLSLCRANNVHTAIESCLFAPYETAMRIAELTDFIQFDLKAMDTELHRRLTAKGNENILENAAALLRGDKPLLARLPLIPGLNDSEENLRATGAFLEKRRAGAALEILKYHRLGVGLYEELGRSYPLPDVMPPSDEEYARAREILSDYNIRLL
ncbi:MAG: glycyl-radical enzyme activating protein [Synergistaceae bacterium]|nr:glycyl-radical enzyme activating protein [Synergistaceae bacterium]